MVVEKMVVNQLFTPRCRCRQVNLIQGSSMIYVQIGATGFEPATSWSRTKRSSQAEPRPGVVLRYAILAECVWRSTASRATIDFVIPGEPEPSVSSNDAKLTLRRETDKCDLNDVYEIGVESYLRCVS